MGVMAEISMFPVDKGESLSPYVARIIDLIDRSGLTYVVTPMGTIIEAENLEDIFRVIKDCFEELKKDCNRIVINLKVDYRKTKESRLKAKIISVEEKLGREVKKVLDW